MHSLSRCFHIILNIGDLSLPSMFLIWNPKGVVKSVKLSIGEIQMWKGQRFLSVIVCSQCRFSIGCTVESHHFKSMPVSFSSYQCKYTTIITPRLFIIQLPDVIMNTMIKSNLRKKGFIWFKLPGHTQSSREVRAETQAKTEAETIEEYYWFLSLWLAQLLFL